jgi:hypothetical protein
MGAITDPNTVLMTAILSMDVYERDPAYGSKVVQNELSKVLGSATLLGQPSYNSNTEFDYGDTCLFPYLHSAASFGPLAARRRLASKVVTVTPH